MFLMYFRLRFSFKRSSFALNRKWRRHFELIQFIVLLMVTWLEKWHHWVQVYASYIAKHKLNTNPMLTCQIVIKALLLSPPNTSHVHSTHTHTLNLTEMRGNQRKFMSSPFRLSVKRKLFVVFLRSFFSYHLNYLNMRFVQQKRLKSRCWFSRTICTQTTITAFWQFLRFRRMCVCVVIKVIKVSKRAKSERILT